MEVGCGGIGLRTSEGTVVNLYFWHIEREGGRSVRREDFLGRADSRLAKRELLRRMARYNRRVEERLARHAAKLEQEPERFEREARRDPAVF
ncbi:MAG: hypothetical protein WC985_06255 [Thermoplasmata archaeon]